MTTNYFTVTSEGEFANVVVTNGPVTFKFNDYGDLCGGNENATHDFYSFAKKVADKFLRVRGSAWVGK